MLASGAIILFVMGGVLTLFTLLASGLMVIDRRQDVHRRHWQVLESEMHV